MQINQRVMLVGTDGFMPPMGACGTVVSELDAQGDHEVLFDSHPCPVPPGITWWVPVRMLMPIDPSADVFVEVIHEAIAKTMGMPTRFFTVRRVSWLNGM